MITVPSLATDGGLGNQGLLKPVGGPGETRCRSTYGQLRCGTAGSATPLVVDNFYGVDRPSDGLPTIRCEVASHHANGVESERFQNGCDSHPLAIL